VSGDGIGPNKTMRTNSSLAPRARRRTESSPTCCSVRGFDSFLDPQSPQPGNFALMSSFRPSIAGPCQA